MAQTRGSPKTDDEEIVLWATTIHTHTHGADVGKLCRLHFPSLPANLCHVASNELPPTGIEANSRRARGEAPRTTFSMNGQNTYNWPGDLNDVPTIVSRGAA